jgi:hypothetical protein
VLTAAARLPSSTSSFRKKNGRPVRKDSASSRRRESGALAARGRLVQCLSVLPSASFRPCSGPSSGRRSWLRARRRSVGRIRDCSLPSVATLVAACSAPGASLEEAVRSFAPAGMRGVHRLVFRRRGPPATRRGCRPPVVYDERRVCTRPQAQQRRGPDLRPILECEGGKRLHRVDQRARPPSSTATSSPT